LIRAFDHVGSMGRCWPLAAIVEVIYPQSQWKLVGTIQPTSHYPDV
jgi:hypothetical protein